MIWYINEIVTSGSSTARIKSYDKDTGYMVIMDMQGDDFYSGCTIVGAESGSVGTLSNFSVDDELEKDEYTNTEWDDLDNMVFDGDGNLVGIDEHFTGLLSQDYQTTYIVREI